MNAQVENFDTDAYTPEVPCQETDVEESSAGQPEHDRCQRVEQRKDQCVTGQVSANFTVPCSCSELVLVEDASLSAIPNHAPEAQLTDDFVKRPLGNEEFLDNVADTITSSTNEGEQIALDLISLADTIARGCSSDVITTNQDANASDADQDANNLRDVIPDPEKDEGYDNNNDYGKEVDQLCG